VAGGGGGGGIFEKPGYRNEMKYENWGTPSIFLKLQEFYHSKESAKTRGEAWSSG
jgi:hypothetical protein